MAKKKVLVGRQRPLPQPRLVKGRNMPAHPVGPPAPPAPLPPDPTEALAQQQATRNLELGNLESQYQTGQLYHQYGYNQQGQIDPSNPYSRAALLQHTYQQTQRGTMNSYAASGQLYSGALGRAQGENTRQYSIQDAALREGLAGQLHQVGFGQLQNAANYGLNMTQADYDALLRALGAK
jgi:hypothetical protein